MKTVIKNITLSFFKGVKNATYDMGAVTNIFGQNGIGKSTIATAFYWLFADKSVELVSNSPIRPDDMEECIPRVEVVLDIDGREIIVAKSQKQKVKEDKEKGTRKVSLTNFYEINGVEKSERDFKAYLSDLGFDFNKFLFLSHPDVFTAGMNEKKTMEQMRKTLFEMSKNYSDIDIVNMLINVEEIKLLLEKKYTLEEIKAMQDSTLRKIKENYGKDGEILRAEIKAKEELKVDIDVAELELGRNVLKEMISDNKSKQEDISKQYEEFQNTSAEIIELKAKQSEILRIANLELVEKKKQHGIEMANLAAELRNLDFSINQYGRQIEDNKKELALKNTEIQKMRDDLKVAKERKFDETSLICPYCKQEYPAEKKEQLKSDFEKHKYEECENITTKGKELKTYIDHITQKNVEFLIKKADAEKERTVLANKISELNSIIDALPTSIDVSGREDYKELQKQIEENQAIYNNGFDTDGVRAFLKEEEKNLQEQLIDTERKIASAQRNVEIDEQISELLEKQKQYEQDKANSEKVLEQIKVISKKKNELLVDNVNDHFEIVKWQLFDFQKNGEYKEVCIPTIDGKRFGESTNTGREVLAKLDIIKGLQKFYGQYYPVFLDGAECLSEETKKRINMDCQMIYLIVPNIPDIPLILDEDISDDERERLIAEWEERKKALEEYYKELRIEVK